MNRSTPVRLSRNKEAPSGLTSVNWLRAVESNHAYGIQKPVSYQIDDPGMYCTSANFVGLEGVEPSSLRLRAGYVSHCHHKPIVEWRQRESNPHPSG